MERDMTKETQADKLEEEKKKVDKEFKGKEVLNKSKIEKRNLIEELTVIPIDEKEKIELDYERTNNYVSLKEKKIEREFNNKKSALRRVGDFLYKKLYDFPMVSKKEIAKSVGISINVVNTSISHLNFYSGYPLTIIPVYKKKDFVQAITKNEDDSISWEKRKFRTIETMQHTKDKGERLIKNKEKIIKSKKEEVMQNAKRKKTS